MSKSHKRNAWRLWTLLFVPLFGASIVAMHLFGFHVVLPAMFAILGATLLFQRYVRQRSWQEILWGRET